MSLPSLRRTRALYYGGLVGLSLLAYVAFVFLIGAGRPSGPGLFLALAVLCLGSSVRLIVLSVRALAGSEVAQEGAEVLLRGGRRKELEREYQAIKRALKELELDHAMGKLSDGDYGEIRGRYRERAVRLMRLLEKGQGQAETLKRQLEADLMARRQALGLSAPPSHRGGEAGAAPGAQEESRTCVRCTTRNDTDASFCKKCGGKLARAALALCLLLTGALASAQPGMPDPKMMSGIPRPDPQVARGTITVRLIRGELANRITFADVDLVSLTREGDRRTAKTDAEGRATFSDLPPGSYEARAVVDGEALASQRIDLPAEMGVRVMLVFDKSIEEQQKELDTPDGKARPSLALPPGELFIKVVDGAGRPLPGLSVLVSHADRETEKVDTLPEQRTSAEGSVRLSGLKTGPRDGYIVTVTREGVKVRSQPFGLIKDHGSQLTMEVREASQDRSVLTIGSGSHIILELDDDTVQVLLNLRLHNPLAQPVDPGPGGLRVPLAEGALSPQVLPGQGGHSPPLEIDVSREGEPPQAVWKGPVPPGDTDLRLVFVLKQQGSLRFHQVVPLSFEALRVVIEKIEGMQVEGRDMSTEEREFGGRRFMLLSGPGPKAGEAIEFTVSGLPYNRPFARWGAGLLAAIIVLLSITWTSRALAGREDGTERRKQLEARRQILIEQVLRAEQDGAAPEKRRKGTKSLSELRAELMGIYQELDRVGEG